MVERAHINDKQRQADEPSSFQRACVFVRTIRVDIMTVAPQPLSLSLEADARSLAPMRRALRAWLTDIDAEHISDVVLAVDEAVANAIEHAGVPEGGAITVQARVDGSTLHIEICDEGVWKEPALSETRGRGIAIMNSVMDGVSIEHRDNDTRIVMTREIR
jgi:anti-sigma regulatory factor (Ser/Thr protein kinase)